MKTIERREHFSQSLHPRYLEKYWSLCEHLPDEWQPFYGIRSIKTQEALFAQGRTESGKIVTNAPGGFSPHNWGCATDWCIFENGLPVWPKYNDLRWLDYSHAIEKSGLVWGGVFKKFPDRPHNELELNCSWADVGRYFLKHGDQETRNFIERNMR